MSFYPMIGQLLSFQTGVGKSMSWTGLLANYIRMFKDKFLSRHFGNTFLYLIIQGSDHAGVGADPGDDAQQ